jgi:hypothetical protein
MIKLLTIAILGVILYRMLFPGPRIEGGKNSRKSEDRQDGDDYVDYEELD